jgi:predicted acylesterase/phospholipase RssA
MSQPRTAFVLAGGGSLGALQVGMLAEILEAGRAEFPGPLNIHTH